MVALQVAFGSYEVGVIQRTPVPPLDNPDGQRLGELALDSFHVKRSLDAANETSHAFILPALLQVEGVSLPARVAAWDSRVVAAQDGLARNQAEIDDIAFRLYGISEEDRAAIEGKGTSGEDQAVDEDGEVETAADEEAQDEGELTVDPTYLANNLLSYCVGAVFGRWDARIALDSSLAPKLQDPFDPLPVCSPGTLMDNDGLPATRDNIVSEEWLRARPDAITLPPDGSVRQPTIPVNEYPLAIDWDGILVDDPNHSDDIVRRVRDVLRLLWGERADDVEAEVVQLLGVKDLREYFRNPRNFWEHHVKLYSRSRRKAPIYWLLKSPRRLYGIWLYYHRLDSDLLFKVLVNYVEPKIRLEEGRLADLKAERLGQEGREARRLDSAIDSQETLLADVREFRDRLERAAKLYLKPDHNDGVILNIAPLREVVPWKEAGNMWEELLAGKYEWSSISQQLRERGMI